MTGFISVLERKSVAGHREILKVPCYSSEWLRILRAASLTSIMDTIRTQYSGLSRKLIVALDIGTTFSGAAYVLLDPGEIPQIQSVMRRVIPLVSDPGTTVTN